MVQCQSGLTPAQRRSINRHKQTYESLIVHIAKADNRGLSGEAGGEAGAYFTAVAH